MHASSEFNTKVRYLELLTYVVFVGSIIGEIIYMDTNRLMGHDTALSMGRCLNIQAYTRCQLWCIRLRKQMQMIPSDNQTSHSWLYVESFLPKTKWRSIKTYYAIFGGMNIHLPANLFAVLKGTRWYQGFDPHPNISQKSLEPRVYSWIYPFWRVRTAVDHEFPSFECQFYSGSIFPLDTHPKYIVYDYIRYIHIYIYYII
jgi:hypothetical protein